MFKKIKKFPKLISKRKHKNSNKDVTQDISYHSPSMIKSFSGNISRVDKGKGETTASGSTLNSLSKSSLYNKTKKKKGRFLNLFKRKKNFFDKKENGNVNSLIETSHQNSSQLISDESVVNDNREYSSNEKYSSNESSNEIDSQLMKNSQYQFILKKIQNARNDKISNELISESSSSIVSTSDKLNLKQKTQHSSPVKSKSSNELKTKIHSISTLKSKSFNDLNSIISTNSSSLQSLSNQNKNNSLNKNNIPIVSQITPLTAPIQITSNRINIPTKITLPPTPDSISVSINKTRNLTTCTESSSPLVTLSSTLIDNSSSKKINTTSVVDNKMEDNINTSFANLSDNSNINTMNNGLISINSNIKDSDNIYNNGSSKKSGINSQLDMEIINNNYEFSQQKNSNNEKININTANNTSINIKSTAKTNNIKQNISTFSTPNNNNSLSVVEEQTKTKRKHKKLSKIKKVFKKIFSPFSHKNKLVKENLKEKPEIMNNFSLKMNGENNDNKLIDIKVKNNNSNLSSLSDKSENKASISSSLSSSSDNALYMASPKKVDSYKLEDINEKNQIEYNTSNNFNSPLSQYMSKIKKGSKDSKKKIQKKSSGDSLSNVISLGSQVASTMLSTSSSSSTVSFSSSSSKVSKENNILSTTVDSNNTNPKNESKENDKRYGILFDKQEVHKEIENLRREGNEDNDNMKHLMKEDDSWSTVSSFTEDGDNSYDIDGSKISLDHSEHIKLIFLLIFNLLH